MENMADHFRIKEELQLRKDPAFLQFTSRLLPGVEGIVGVRLPDLRIIAKQIAKEDWQEYLASALDDSYEEIMLQGLVLGYAKGGLQEKEKYLRQFLPKIDNWSVCDSACATIRIADRQPEEFWAFLEECLYSGREYHIRFALVQMLDYYINEKYLQRVLDAVDQVNMKAYYVQMAQAWAVSICYREFPQETLPYLHSNHLDNFTHNKAVQKIIESRKVPKKEKERVKKLRR